MARVVIVGAGIGGLATALLLGRQGREVLVCERDPAPVPASAEDMWNWDRPGVPQARLGHTFLAGFRVLLEERAPDVLDRLLAAGAPLVDFSLDMPGGGRRAEDAEMASIMCRRHVLEGVVRQVVEEEPGVQVRRGCDVTGMLAEPSGGDGIPTVAGVRTRQGEGIPADTVVISGGRLLPVRRWFQAIGAEPPEEITEGTGLLCFTRFFRLHLAPGENHRVSTQLTVHTELPHLAYEIFGADGGTFCVELAPPSWDRELRGLRHQDVHMEVARRLTEAAGWLDPSRAEPIGPIAAMGQEHNTLRRFVRGGRPLALGVHVIGDARCQTNSFYAWGSRNALWSAATLVDVMAEHPGDPEAQALDLEQRIDGELAARHAYAMARDRSLDAAFRAETQPRTVDRLRDEVVRTVLPASDVDAELFRAAGRWNLQLDPADSLERDPALLARARAVTRSAELPAAPSTPTRDELLDVIARCAPAGV
jgi:2-polyprenyl-6-methoxyphenol hydroxylase-like FAD-dependent oxidoreductase